MAFPANPPPEWFVVDLLQHADQAGVSRREVARRVTRAAAAGRFDAARVRDMADPPEADLMKRRPRDPRAGVFTRPLIVLLLTGGVRSAVVNSGLFAWLLHSGRALTEAMAMTFVSLVLIQFLEAYGFRSDRFSILRRPFANRWLDLAVAWELVLLVAVVCVPFLQRPFGTFTFAWTDWVLTVALAFTVLPVLHAVKWLERHGYLGELK